VSWAVSQIQYLAHFLTHRASLGTVTVNSNDYMPNADISYLPVLVLMVAALGFGLGPLALAWIWARTFSPNKPGLGKNAAYECGLESKGDAWVQFKSQYYLYAIIFLIFDVETIFLLPFAVAFTGLGAGAFVAMMIFLLLLVEGLVWAWKKGVLAWK
jgi:NADH:ubiquinone oxidoreductase subunit 3 (subunit A)